jgi:hypothetical protein
MDQNARSPNLRASSVMTPASTWAENIRPSCPDMVAGAASPMASCAETASCAWSVTAVGAPTPENRPWNSTWLTATDAASRSHDSDRPASAVHTVTDSTNDASTPSQDGGVSPPSAWDSAATNVATAAAVVPRPTRAHLESTSRSLSSDDACTPFGADGST